MKVIDREKLDTLLTKAIEAQTARDEAMSDLEEELGGDLEDFNIDPQTLDTYDVDELIEATKE